MMHPNNHTSNLPHHKWSNVSARVKGNMREKHVKHVMISTFLTEKKNVETHLFYHDTLWSRWKLCKLNWEAAGENWEAAKKVTEDVTYIKAATPFITHKIQGIIAIKHMLDLYSTQQMFLFHALLVK